MSILSSFINASTPLVAAFAVLIFFWGLMMYLFNASDRDKRTEGVNIMFLGVVVLFVMVAIWGLVHTFLG